MRSLSRLRSLQAFEAAARHGSFTAAGAELGVTPTAVGQLVRSLEDWVGRPVFRRTRSGRDRLRPTEEARAALADIAQGLDALDAGLARLRGPGARSVVLVTASQALVSNWLIFRLDRFTAAHPEIDLRLDVSDRTLDLAAGEADVGIRCGPGDWTGLAATRLMDEVVIAVASPSLLPDGATADAGWLARQTLIHDPTPHPGGGLPDWDGWLAGIGLDRSTARATLGINATAAVVQAAVAGRGVALMRRVLVANDLATRRLREVWPGRTWPIRWAYWVAASPAALRRREVAAFHRWIVDDVGAG